MLLVFISYCRDNPDKAAASLASDLKALGHEIWSDKDLRPGERWWDSILDKIRKCDIFAFALDPGALRSQACKREFEYAIALKKNILPVLVADRVPEDLMWLELQYVDYRLQDRDAVIALAKAIADLPPPVDLPYPLPEAPAAPISYKVGLRERIMTSETLSFKEQSAILVELRGVLRESNYAEDDVAMARDFRSRDDLLAKISRELDELLDVIDNRPNPEPEPEAEPKPEPRQLTLWEKFVAGWQRIFGSNTSTRGEDPSAEVLSLKQIWISLVFGLLISGILDRWAQGSDLTIMGWLILQPTWSLPGALLLFSSVIWKMLYFRPTYTRVGLILFPLLIGYTVAYFAKDQNTPLPQDPKIFWVWNFAGAVISLLIVIIVFWNDKPDKKTSLWSAAFSLAGGFAALVVLCIYGGGHYLAGLALARSLASIFGIYILSLFGRMLIARLQSRLRAR